MLLDPDQHEVLARGAELPDGLYCLAYAAAVAQLNQKDHVIGAPGAQHVVQYSPIRLLEVKA
jgi:hypothetical protein